MGATANSGARGGRRSMRRRAVGVGCVAIMGAALAACSSGTPNTGPGSAALTHTSTHGAAGQTTTTTTVATVASTPPTSAPAGAQNLVATAAVKSALVASYVAHTGLPAAEIAGTAPGSVYDGYLPSTQTYWALATFEPTAAGEQDPRIQVGMQDGGATGIFTMASGVSSWTDIGQYDSEGDLPCASQLPAALIAVWGDVTSTATSCSPSSTLFSDALAQWQEGASASSADQGQYLHQAATDLTLGDGDNPSYTTAANELLQLAALPETGDTPAQMTEAQNDLAALNMFFGTSGLYE
jgi:hypothetical protein